MAMAWILAAIMGRLLRATGLVDSLVWLGVNVGVGGGMLPLATFIIAALFSTATGSFGGSIAAIGPLMLPVGVGLGASPLVMIGSLMSGAFFGDNIAPISDTTIASAYTQGAEIKEVVQSRLKYAFVAAGFAAVMFVIFGLATKSDSATAAVLAREVSPRGLIMIVVPALLIFLMFRGVHLITALMTSNAFGIVLGLVTGLLTPKGILFADPSAGQFSGVLYSGINGMLPIIMFTMLLLGLVGVFDKAGLFDRILNRVAPLTRSVRNDVVHYCVTNMPGAVARTSTIALTNATLPYALEIAENGWRRAMRENREIMLGANIMDGRITYKAVAEAFDMDFTPIEELLQEPGA
jgi:Na+/H+ antiporter NhaC